ncbi:MAG: MBL fold metallo-hydrolase [Ignavibacteriales bacterium]|nr:MBL fold metallo-hydrolase [Ignavibacteriales bacterium]
MATKITLLGSRGWMPIDDRQTMCILVQINDKDFLLDCGTGISRFRSPQVKQLLKSQTLNILFSHYHLDHIMGLTYLTGLFKKGERKIRLVGPSNKILDYGLGYACDLITQPPIFGTPLKKFDLDIELLEYDSYSIVVDDIKISFLKQPHKGGSLAIRLADQVCYMTDTGITDQAASFAYGTKCLLHESWLVDRNVLSDYHATISRAISIAQDANIRQLIPIHFSQTVTEREIQNTSAYSTSQLQVLPLIEGITYTLD